MATSGTLRTMTDQQILFRLVDDVASLKKDAEHGARSRERTQNRMDRIEESLADVNRKLDAILAYERRLAEVENGVLDYRNTKMKIVSIIAGIGLGGGSVGGFLGAMLAKIFGGGS